MKKILLIGFILLLTFPGFSQRERGNTSSTPAVNFDPSLYSSLEWRNIGPFRGGRSNAVTGVPGNDQVYFAGYTGGGIWKTENAGISWKNISDGQLATSSVGDIAISESDPNVIYVGMGEHAIRGVMTSYGDGV
ncbi:MAG: glycosyl hydrolase, partial [Cyclobacteriaceae bacterium]|nr:glycosyl hydrolase [Cyclobacteriaceae bacterium]